MRQAADYGQQFADLIGSAFSIALKVVIFLAIIGLGWFVGAWLRKWLASLLRRVGFDRAVEHGGLQRIVGPGKASELSARLVFLAFMLFVLQLAFGIFGPNPVSDLIRNVIAWLPRLFAAVVIVVVAAAIAGWVRDAIAEALGGLGYGRAVATTAQVLILALAAIAALNQIGVAAAVTLPVLVAALATVAGVIIVGVGGGLIRPMQDRWDRILTRAEAESTTAAEKVRAHRAGAPTRPRRARDGNGFGQPAYPGRIGSHAWPELETEPGPETEPDNGSEPDAGHEPDAGTKSDFKTDTLGVTEPVVTEPAVTEPAVTEPAVTGDPETTAGDAEPTPVFLPPGAKLAGIALTDASKPAVRPAAADTTEPGDDEDDQEDPRPARRGWRRRG